MGIKDLNEYKKRERKYNEEIQKIPEIWKYINICDIISGYKISNHGRITSIKGTIKCTELRRNYEYVKLYTTRGTRSSYQVHRLVAMMFLEIPKKYLDLGYTFKSLQVNHINGIPHCNGIINLEWCTPKENTRHAHITGLAWKLHGENNAVAILKNEDVHKICKYLEDGKSNKFIMSKINVSDRTIHAIRSRIVWTDISSQYNFINRINSFDDEIIHSICKDISTGKMSGNEIGRKYGVSNTYIQQLRRKEFRPDITNLYDFSKFIIKEQVPDDIIHGICKDIESTEIPISHIAKKYGLSKTYISDIKHHKKRIDISRHYKF